MQIQIEPREAHPGLFLAGRIQHGIMRCRTRRGMAVARMIRGGVRWILAIAR